MKRLLIALVAAVAVSTGFARLTDTQSFEESFSDFVPSAQNEDASELVAYDNDEPGFDAPYNFENFGLKYLSLDTGDATLWRTNAGDAAYFDMAMQFNPCAAAPEIDDDTKIAVYLNSSSNLVVLAGDGAGGTLTNVTGTTLNPGTWGRLTIASVEDGFMVILNTNTVVGTFASRKGDDKTIKSVGFKGSGALDDFVARTTDPFLQNPAATIGGEGYASLADALADDPTATPQLEANASYTIASRGGSVGVKLNNHTLTVTAPAGLYAYPTTSGDVTTYTADYFPRTATAGQDGTAAHPFEVADVDDLQALSAAVDAATFAGKCYKQTADIDMASAGAFAGIGTYNKTPTAGTPFLGTYDGQGYMIKNVTRAGGNTQGIFNQVGVSGVIENLVVSNMVFDAGVTGEYGFAIVGNAGGGATLRNLTAVGVFGATDKAGTHNMAGIVVRVCGGATAGVTTTIDSCTNNATIYGGYTKLGGICAIVQQQTGFTAGGVVFNDCANNGNLVCVRTAEQCAELDEKGNPKVVTGNAGIIGYTSANNVELTGCSGMGTITNTNGANTDKDAALIGWQYTGYTLKDNGGNSAPANKKMIAYYGNVANVTGFQYATVDNGVATTVTGALAKDTTYLLEGNVAASETPVFTLAAAGDTFKVDTALGYTFAGTVAADTTTLVLAEPVTEGTVTTYSTTAGVASVDDVAYETFGEAVAALDGAADDYVTLLDDVTYEFSYNTPTLKVKKGDYDFTTTKAVADVVVGETTVEGITTYTAAEGMAACTPTGINYVWYATVEEAIAAMYPYYEDGTCDLKVKVGADWTLPSTIAHSWSFYSLTFIATTEDPIKIALTNANYRISSPRYSFPANATLVLAADYEASDASSLTGGGVLEIPEGVTVTMSTGSSGQLENLGGLVGKGTLVAPTEFNPLYFFITKEKYQNWFKAATWQGTVSLAGLYSGTFYPASLANSGSTIQFAGFTNAASIAAGTYNVNLESVGDGLTIGQANSDGDLTISGALKGNGPIIVNAAPSTQYSINFTGDISEYAGSITLANSGKARVAFGTMDVAGVGNCISVGSDVTNTIPAGKTWTANGGFVINGNLTVAGALSTTDNLYGSGTVTFTAPTSIKVKGTWTGTYNANFESGNTAYMFDIPVSASATTVINGDGTSFSGCPKTISGGVNAAPTVGGAVVLNADWTVGFGWTGATTTFARISGSGDLIVNGDGEGDAIPYAITELDGYTGTLGGARGAFTIGKVNVAEPPTSGTRVVATAIGANGSINDNVPLYVGGVDTGKTLTKKADGLYFYETYTITYKNADDTTFSHWIQDYTAPASFTSDSPVTLPTSNEVAMVGGKFDGWTNAVGTVVTTTQNLAADLVVFAKVIPTANTWAAEPDTQITAGTTAAEQYAQLAESELASTDARALTKWATDASKGNGVSIGDVANAKDGDALYDAYLLDCAVDDVETAKENFKIPSITFDGDGKPVIAEPTGSYNGTIQQKGSNDLSTWTVIDDDTHKAENFQFFKLELVP